MTTTMITNRSITTITICQARILLASSSGVYGRYPLQTPQSETYVGHVNPDNYQTACHEETKRVAETLVYSYYTQHKLKVRVARIFPTYGPRMILPNYNKLPKAIGKTDSYSNSNTNSYGGSSNIGKNGENNKQGSRKSYSKSYKNLIPIEMIYAALTNNEIVLTDSYRNSELSIQYIDDTVDALLLLMESNYAGPVNIGNPVTTTVEVSTQISNCYLDCYNYYHDALITIVVTIANVIVVVAVANIVVVTVSTIL